jgi:hypothetical protein
VTEVQRRKAKFNLWFWSILAAVMLPGLLAQGASRNFPHGFSQWILLVGFVVAVANAVKCAEKLHVHRGQR